MVSHSSARARREGLAMDEVNMLVGRGAFSEALKAALREDADAKAAGDTDRGVFAKPVAEERFRTVMAALTATAREGDAGVAKSVAALSVDEGDVLMRYLYHGLAAGDAQQSNVLLKYHDHLTKHAGHGSIMRHLSAPPLNPLPTSL